MGHQMDNTSCPSHVRKSHLNKKLWSLDGRPKWHSPLGALNLRYSWEGISAQLSPAHLPMGSSKPDVLAWGWWQNWMSLVLEEGSWLWHLFPAQLLLRLERNQLLFWPYSSYRVAATWSCSCNSILCSILSERLAQLAGRFCLTRSQGKQRKKRPSCFPGEAFFSSTERVVHLSSFLLPPAHRVVLKKVVNAIKETGYMVLACCLYLVLQGKCSSFYGGLDINSFEDCSLTPITKYFYPLTVWDLVLAVAHTSFMNCISFGKQDSCIPHKWKCVLAQPV